MHAAELIELAAFAAEHSRRLIEARRPIPPESIQRYWKCSKVRLDRWTRTLKGEVDFRPRVRGTIEEIFAAEVLARVWTAVASAYDRRRGLDEAEPVARSVMIGGAEARNRALGLLLRSPPIDAKYAVKLNRLRRQTERFGDRLVEKVESPGAAATDWDGGDEIIDPGACFSAASPNPELNARIAASVIAAFPPELLDGVELRHPLWYALVINAADEAQSMIDGLLAESGR